MQNQKQPYDARFLRARKEAWMIIIAWLVCLVWTIGYTSVTGYNIDGTSVALVFGMPSWIVWGVFVPWLAATVFSIGFALFYMSEA